MESENQKQLGKYYTVSNPFSLKVFRKWFNKIPNISNLTILEPFAGSNNIVRLMDVNNRWDCFDILPTTNLVPEFPIMQRDTIEDFPIGYKLCITNPPYLAKNSATRRGLLYQGEPYDDLYKKCLEVMLRNTDYIAAIIPESFITSGLFQERLRCVVSLTCKMFDDTDCPVCLALFSKNRTADFDVYQMDEYLGRYGDLLKFKPQYLKKTRWTINDPLGEIGIICIDNTFKSSIRFVEGNTIDPSLIKPTSRLITRVSTDIPIKNLPFFLLECNKYLEWYRENTKDIFLTSFKGLRKDGKYRRRLDYETAKAIMETIIL